MPPDLLDAPTAHALARLALGRDAQAWAGLVEEHGPRMYRAAFAVTRDEHAAADACQEAFLRVRDGAHRFSPRGADAESAARAWLVRVAISSALMQVRGSRRRREQELPATLGNNDGPDEADKSPDEALARALRDEIAQLPETYREALMLHVYAGLEYGPMAGALGTTEGNARVRVHRAISRLRSRLARFGSAMTPDAVLPASPRAFPTRTPIRAQNRAPSGGMTATWLGLLSSPLTPAVKATAFTGGLTLMTKLAIVAASLTIAAALIVPMGAARGAENKEPEKHADAPAKAEHGTITGIVMSKEKGRLQVKDAEGHTETYFPRWSGGAPKDGGGPDKEIVEKIAKVNVGDKVTIEWNFEEHRRVLSLKVVEKAAGDKKDEKKEEKKHEERK